MELAGFAQIIYRHLINNDQFILKSSFKRYVNISGRLQDLEHPEPRRPIKQGLSRPNRVRYRTGSAFRGTSLSDEPAEEADAHGALEQGV